VVEQNGKFLRLFNYKANGQTPVDLFRKIKNGQTPEEHMRKILAKLWTC